MAANLGVPAIPPESYVAPRLMYLSEHVYPESRALWLKEFGGDSFVFLEARFRVPHNASSRAALALYALDRETRRALRIVAGRGHLELGETELPRLMQTVEQARAASPRALLRPVGIGTGGFNLVRAESGSADFLLSAYGLLVSSLLADPVQLSLTLRSIFGFPMRVLIRHIPRRGRPAVVFDSDETFRFDDRDLRLVGPLRPGSSFKLRYRRADGSELEVELETPRT